MYTLEQIMNMDALEFNKNWRKVVDSLNFLGHYTPLEEKKVLSFT